MRAAANALKYIASLQWIEDAGRLLVRWLSGGKLATPDTSERTIGEELRARTGFLGKLGVLVRAVLRVFVYTELGLWFWASAVALVIGLGFLVLLVYALIFGPLPSVHEWR